MTARHVLTVALPESITCTCEDRGAYVTPLTGCPIHDHPQWAITVECSGPDEDCTLWQVCTACEHDHLIDEDDPHVVDAMDHDKPLLVGGIEHRWLSGPQQWAVERPGHCYAAWGIELDEVREAFEMRDEWIRPGRWEIQVTLDDAWFEVALLGDELTEEATA